MSDPAEQNPHVEHLVLDDEGGFHVTDEPVDLSGYGWEDWISFAIFWALASTVFYQVFTRYILDDPAGWTEEIARYLLVALVFIGASMAVRKNSHIHVDALYRFLPGVAGRVLSTAVDVVRVLFFGYAAWLNWLLVERIGGQRMAIIDLPMGWVFGAMLFGFILMFLRSLQVTWRHLRQGFSVLERPEIAFEGGEK
ncbi:MAG: TRAP transporter small permease [Betaproteobacteria bacterium]|nr:TRAP transporter small permease [Betaproteobacteria bacterium]